MCLLVLNRDCRIAIMHGLICAVLNLNGNGSSNGVVNIVYSVDL